MASLVMVGLGFFASGTPSAPVMTKVSTSLDTESQVGSLGVLSDKEVEFFSSVNKGQNKEHFKSFTWSQIGGSKLFWR